MTFSPAPFLDDHFTLHPSLRTSPLPPSLMTSSFWSLPQHPLQCPPSSLTPSSNSPASSLYTPAFYLCFPFTLPYVSVIVKPAMIAALKQRTVLRSTSSFFYYTSTLPLSTPPCSSRSLTYTQYPCLHVYCGPVSLPLPLLWPCCLTSTSTVVLFPNFHLMWLCCLTSTSTVALLPYFHLYCGPVVLLPPLLWSCCLTST